MWAVLGVTAGLVAGCGETPEGTAPEGLATAAPAAEPSAGKAPAFHFDSGDLVIGPFDPEHVKHNLFDPCTEISDAEFAEAGLVKADRGSNVLLDQQFVSGCEIESDNLYLTKGIMANAVPKDLILSESLPVGTPTSDVPGAFAFLPPNGRTDICDVGVETDRGTLSVTVSSLRKNDSPDYLCAEAGRILGRLYRAG
ncbi:hypothetical protein C3E79_08010 [Corynebacterium liangguodongii]|uniref:Uncharacterized protein n=2 Tax=Corynebacterium liangguodongii TaxID=2079535 RepID=A0A2S0WF66_9CORY|nr:hypothetical protein C3E79_08010 [Corynebacterium liangguodongii]PWB99969.1 DUF3558 domain-containing protein [Corynebacterium liangguodongii]